MKSLLVVLCLCASTSAAAQDVLGPARQLYASADYEGALTALERLSSDARDDSVMEVEKYRVLCLVALGRSTEADAVIEQMLTMSPLYEPPLGDAPPRIRTAFSRVRERVLPKIARASYDAGKAAYDAKSYDRAVTKLEETLRILDQTDPSKGDLADLRKLTNGFLDLSRASVAPPPTPGPKPAEVAAPKPEPRRADSDPVALRQSLPPWSNAGLGALSRVEYRGAIEVDIDEAGHVVGAQITRPIHPLYDPLLLEASKDWLYQPAYRDGKPSRIRKRVDIVLRPR